MPYQRILTTLLLIALLSSCAPAPTEAAEPTFTFTPTPSPTDTPTSTPTVTPKISLPVDRFQPLPDLMPITSENISNLEPVATYSEGRLLQVNVPRAQDRVVVIYDKGVQVYDLPSLTPRPFLPADLSRSSHSLSPNGKYLAMRNIDTNNRIQIWNLDTQEKTCTFEFPGKIQDAGWPVLMEFFSQTNQFVFRGILEDQDGTRAYQIQFFDLNDCRNVFTVPSDYRTAFSISPDGRRVAYLENEQVTVLNVEDNTKSSFGDSGKILGVGFTADNQSVIIHYPYKIKIYDLVSGEIINESEISNGKENVYIYAVDDGRRILIAWETNNIVWDTETNTSFSLGDEFITIHREWFDDFNGALVTWKSVWNLEKKNRVPLTDYPYGSEFSALSQDATFLAVTSGYAPYQTDLLDTTTGRMITSLPGENAPIAVNGETFITSGNGQMFVRNFSDGALLQTLEGEYMDGILLQEEQVLIWQAAGNIALLDVRQGRLIQQTTLPILPLDYDTGLDHYFYQHSFYAWEDELGFDPSDWLASEGRDTSAISPDHTIGIQQSGDRVQIFSISDDNFFPTTENLLASYFLKGGWVRFKFSSDGKLIAGFTYSQMIIWDGQTGKQIRGFYGKDYVHSSHTNFGFSADGSKIFVGRTQLDGLSRSLTILDVKSGALVQTYEAPDCNLNVPYIVTADSSQVFTITPDCRVGLFNIADGRKVKSLGDSYSGSDLALALSPDGKLLAVGHQKSLEIWDVDSGTLLKKFDNLDTHIQNFIGDFSLTFSPDGKLVAVRYGRWFLHESTVTIFGVPVAP